MSETTVLVLRIFALGCFLIAAFIWGEVVATGPVYRRIHFGWLGMVFAIASVIPWGH